MKHEGLDRPLVEYTPNMRHRMGLVGIVGTMVRNIVRSQDLIWELFKRDFFAQYRKSFLGMTWLLLAPLLGVASWVFLQAAGLLVPGDVGVPYPVYVLMGSAFWGFFLSMYRSSADTLGAGAGLLLQVSYAHESLLFQQVLIQIANFSITFLINIAIMVAFGVFPSWKAVLAVPCLLPLFFLGGSVGLLAAMVRVVAMDITRLLEAVLAILIYTTPIVYSSNVQSTAVRTMIAYNPLTYLVCTPRDLVLSGTMSSPTEYALSALGAFLLFMYCWRLFYVSEDKIVERIL